MQWIQKHASIQEWTAQADADTLWLVRLIEPRNFIYEVRRYEKGVLAEKQGGYRDLYEAQGWANRSQVIFDKYRAEAAEKAAAVEKAVKAKKLASGAWGLLDSLGEDD